MRKFIRKILKLINKDNLLKINNIDIDKYNSDKVYKIIKKYKIAYNSLTKDSILNLILNYDRSTKNGKIENGSFILKQKPIKKKPEKDKENLYLEKITKRKISTDKSKIIKTIKKEDEEKNDNDNVNKINNNFNDNSNINNNYELSKESYNDLKNSEVYSVKLKKREKLEKKLKIKNGNI